MFIPLLQMSAGEKLNLSVELFGDCGRINSAWMNVYLNRTNCWEGQPSHFISFSCASAHCSERRAAPQRYYQVLRAPSCSLLLSLPLPSASFCKCVLSVSQCHMVYGQLLHEPVKLTSSGPLWQVVQRLECELNVRLCLFACLGWYLVEKKKKKEEDESCCRLKASTYNYFHE